MKPRLTVQNLSVRIRAGETKVLAVEDLTFAVFPGEVLAMVGESGCGKSVTAMSILGLLPPRAEVSGRITFDDTELLSLPPRAMRGLRGDAISVVFQEPMTSLNPVFKVGRQVAEVLRRHRGLSKREARERTIELFELVRIPAPSRRVDDYPHEMSGGMQQRVMIAMALACEPDILIADEPTTALDVTLQAETLAILRDLGERLGMSIMLITHDLGIVADLADRVLVMYAGRKVEEASTRDLFAQPQHPYTRALLGALPRSALISQEGEQRRLEEIPGMVPVRHQAADHCVFSSRCPRARSRCRAELPQLEDKSPEHLAACFYPGEEPSREYADS